MNNRKKIYYTDETTDEFAKAKIKAEKIGSAYKYKRSEVLTRSTRFLMYPYAFIFTKFVLHQKTVDLSERKKYSETGYFLYGNHTCAQGDPLVPNIFDFPKRTYFVVNADNVSMPVLGRLTPYMGALPLPDDTAAYRNFSRAIEKAIKSKNRIVIYPEAHIWPYYTKIRNFPDGSFSYPVKLDVPVFCFTNTYQKRRFSKKPKMVTYIDGPFFPDKDLPLKERIKDLRDRVYLRMCERAENSDCVMIEYIKKEEYND